MFFLPSKWLERHAKLWFFVSVFISFQYQTGGTQFLDRMVADVPLVHSALKVFHEFSSTTLFLSTFRSAKR